MALRRKHLLLVFAATIALGAPGKALATGGSYVFDGGTKQERTQVKAALTASSFNWSVVPATVTIHIERGTESHAKKGQIWLDADLVDTGRFAWGAVQHEYGHQVDFFLLDDSMRAALLARLGGKSWCTLAPGLTHADLGCERFASSLAWSYWSVAANCMRPTSALDEAGSIGASEFRVLLGSLLQRPLMRVLGAKRRP
ncbi:MAG: hypothetical protein QOE36_1346 [Gaiellaceae bacterium]|jgi:hypothetical protein|nr:hypothetical protein [Gaiellaceae bacterium]